VRERVANESIGPVADRPKICQSGSDWLPICGLLISAASPLRMRRCGGCRSRLRCCATAEKNGDSSDHREQNQVSFHYNCFGAPHISGRIFPLLPLARLHFRLFSFPSSLYSAFRMKFTRSGGHSALKLNQEPGIQELRNATSESGLRSLVSFAVPHSKFRVPHSFPKHSWFHGFQINRP
jgi:hypothetical protein